MNDTDCNIKLLKNYKLSGFIVLCYNTVFEYNYPDGTIERVFNGELFVTYRGVAIQFHPGGFPGIQQHFSLQDSFDNVRLLEESEWTNELKVMVENILTMVNL